MIQCFLRLTKTTLPKVLDRGAREDRGTIVEIGIENDEIVLKGMMSEKRDVELRLGGRENLHRHLLRALRLLARMTIPKGIGIGKSRNFIFISKPKPTKIEGAY